MTSLTAREILDLLRFRRLDRHNGSIAGNEAAVEFCGQVAELLERLMRRQARNNLRKRRSCAGVKRDGRPPRR